MRIISSGLRLCRFEAGAGSGLLLWVHLSQDLESFPGPIPEAK